MAVVTLYSGGTEILSTYDKIIQIGKPSGAQCCDVADCYFKTIQEYKWKEKVWKNAICIPT